MIDAIDPQLVGRFISNFDLALNDFRLEIVLADERQNLYLTNFLLLASFRTNPCGYPTLPILATWSPATP